MSRDLLGLRNKPRLTGRSAGDTLAWLSVEREEAIRQIYPAIEEYLQAATVDGYGVCARHFAMIAAGAGMVSANGDIAPMDRDLVEGHPLSLEAKAGKFDREHVPFFHSVSPG